MSWLHSSWYYQVQGCSTTHATLFLYWAYTLNNCKNLPFMNIPSSFSRWWCGILQFTLFGPKVLIGTLSTKIKLWYHFITTLLSTQYCLLQDYNDTHDPPTNSNFVSFIGPISLRQDNNSMLRKRIHFFDNMGHCIK